MDYFSGEGIIKWILYGILLIGVVVTIIQNVLARKRQSRYLRDHLGKKIDELYAVDAITIIYKPHGSVLNGQQFVNLLDFKQVPEAAKDSQSSARS